MKNSMIKRILDCLKVKQEKNELKDYSVRINNTKTLEQFFVIQALETTRETETSEAEVTVYKTVGKDLLGQSSFVISHEMSKNEIDKAIDKALFSASFVKNKAYELVSGEKKMKKVRKAASLDQFELLQDIALEYIKASVDNKDYSVKFNSLELFYNENDVRLINSKGVDYEKKTSEIMIEAIPSFTNKKNNFKTELYRMFKYTNIDGELLNKVYKDASEAVSDCLLRADAKTNDGKKVLNVVLRNKDIRELFDEVISTYGYNSVYNKGNLHSIGDSIQGKAKTKLDIKLCKMSKEDFFDGEGILLNDIELVKGGKLVSYFGGQRFASYLGMKPTGSLGLLKIAKGKKSISELEKDPYLEIIDLSGIQCDVFQGFLGGEIRLAKYFDGKNCYPISGLSFSTSLENAINNFEFSSEETAISGYNGPKYMVIGNVEIN